MNIWTWLSEQIPAFVRAYGWQAMLIVFVVVVLLLWWIGVDIAGLIGR